MRRWSVLTLLLVSCQAAAEGPGAGARVDNFQLLDHTGAAHELYYLSDAAAIVLMIYNLACPAADQASIELQAVRDRYHARGVRVLMLDPDDRDTRGDVTQRLAAGNVDLPVLMDETGLVAEALGATDATEVLLIDPRTWTVTYRGPIDGEHLSQWLDALLDGTAQPGRVPVAASCPIGRPASQDTGEAESFSYARQIAPLLIDSCIPCHREGGTAPWAMSSHRMVQGFAPMIREVIMTNRMPPWHADPEHGSFANDRSLTNQQRRMLVHWIESGAPRGSGPDPLPAPAGRPWPDWHLGKPDLILELPAFEVPATGIVDYRYVTVTNPRDEEAWVSAMEVLPGDRRALHHAIVTLGNNGSDALMRVTGEDSLGGYVPGNDGTVYPDGTGVLLPPGQAITLQIHYTTFGKATTDVTRLGLHFANSKPKHRLRTRALLDPGIRIPAHARAHTETTAHTFGRDVVVYTLLPHSHYRGSASSFRALYRDGSQETLLSVPAYDFNWQTTYELETPKLLPAGTRLIHSTTYDNSAQNPANPDPDREVSWGVQSTDEMLYGAVRYREVVPGEPLGERVELPPQQ